MKFTPTRIADVVQIDLERLEDHRGFFARAFCTREFSERGLDPSIAQINITHNRVAGTLRGMHFRVPAGTESKVVRCTAGAILDVVVDLRPDSPTHLEHVAVELSAENRRALFVPPMFAHGYQTLVDDTELLYLMGDYYQPGTDRGLRYDDPRLAISWPLQVTEISEKDRNWKLLDAS